MRPLATPLALLALATVPFAQDVGDDVELPSGARAYVRAAGAADGPTPGPTDRVVAHVVARGGAGPELDTRALGAPVALRLRGSLPGEPVPPELAEALGRMRPGDRWDVALPRDASFGPEVATRGFDVEVLAVDPGPPLPEFRAPGAGATTADGGVVVETLTPGDGLPSIDDEPVILRYTVWTEDGALVDSSLVTGVDLVAPPSRLKVPALRELALAYGRGGVALARVPAAEGSGDETTIWHVEVRRVLRPEPVPPFAPTIEANTLRTDSGLGYEVLRAGDGVRARPGDQVLVHYVGWLTDGTVFDESLSRALPYDLGRGGLALREGFLVPGWVEGIPLMREGGLWRLEVPPHLGYGDRDQGSIPAGSTLVFLVELVAVL